MDFETLQHFADSWGLAYMVVLFLILIGFLLRPRARQAALEAAAIPFREDSGDRQS
jgi:cytochrome c oxidase cbb3-type subunit 4